ncbi:hypothetical protein [uncultured Chitinophaga sp.]|uniref:hypothetical protein n=1 Tax=uncultured Chitinophaga sp. TaxID=339340 RepID=UPI0025F0129C|nr:hypothetical protein [uncultured Chitinophaga sp.]
MKNTNLQTIIPVLTWNGLPWQGQCTVQHSAPPAANAGGSRLNIKNAIVYAMRVGRDRTLSAFYLSFCRGKNSVRRTAAMDYKHGPVIHAVAFEGKKGLQTIYVDASDNISVDAVKIIVYGAGLKQQETGLAEYSAEIGGWEYQLTTNGAAQVKVIATDIPGNKATAIIQFD